MSSVLAVAQPLLQRFGMLDASIAAGACSHALEAGFVVSGELGGVPVTEDTVMYAASLTKQLVGALAALAATSGQLDPDGSVRDVLHELPVWTQPIRIRDLVHHVSGLPPTERTVSALGPYCQGPPESAR